MYILLEIRMSSRGLQQFCNRTGFPDNSFRSRLSAWLHIRVILIVDQRLRRRMQRVRKSRNVILESRRYREVIVVVPRFRCDFEHGCLFLPSLSSFLFHRLSIFSSFISFSIWLNKSPRPRLERVQRCQAFENAISLNATCEIKASWTNRQPTFLRNKRYTI